MYRILIVDDEPDPLTLFSMVLSREGFDVVGVRSGEEALREYSTAKNSSRPFDLVILDLAMPYMNGFEVEEKIRSVGDSSTKVAFFTCHPLELTDDSSKDRTEAIERSVGQWSKPVLVDKFVDLVKGALN